MKDTYIQDINGQELFEDGVVLYQVKRCSSSHSSWGLKRNKHHGLYRIHGTIKFEKGKFIIEANENEYKELIKPRGKEIFEQNVWFQYTDLAEAEKVEKIDLFSRYEIAKNKDLENSPK